jgi:hypothetical protein
VLIHVKGQIDMTKLIDVFHNFANAPKNEFGMSIGEARIMLSIPYTAKSQLIFNLTCSTGAYV